MEKQDNQPVEITFRLPQERLGELARLLLSVLSPQSEPETDRTVERGENAAFQQELFQETARREEGSEELIPPAPPEQDPELPLPPVSPEQDPELSRQETVPPDPEMEERAAAGEETEEEPVELQSFRDRSMVLPKEEDALRSSGMAADRLSTAYERDARRYDGGFPRY